MNLIGVIEETGYAIHGLALYDDDLFWISTDTWEIRSSSGIPLKLPRLGFSRGFVVTDEHFIIATSEHLARHLRTGGNSWIRIFKLQDGKLVRAFHLIDTGSINDIRLLDGIDYAHGVAPFWPQ